MAPKMDINELMRQIDDRVQELELKESCGKDAAEDQEGGGAPPPSQDWTGRQPLILLDFPQARGKTTIDRLRGKFCPSAEEVSFQARTWQGRAVELSGAVCEERLFPLLEALLENGCEVDLNGSTYDDIFSVYEIHTAPGAADHRSSGQRSAISDHQLQALLDRLLGRQTSHSPENIPVFSTQEELQLLFRACKYSYPPSVRSWAERSFSSLAAMPALLGSTNRRHILKALSYILNIDWTTKDIDLPGLDEVRAGLDRRFYGLETVKQRILEITAQLRITKTLPKWGILLNGPAGVGKTSVAKAIAEILGMPMACLEFSAIRDSEALTGTSRIYDNGKPGLVIEQLYANRTAGLVMVLNEIDKAAGGRQGSSPLDTLLPLLDGLGFTDTYLETAIPTDGIFFIATSNEADKLSKPVLDRFYRIDIPRYSAEEKSVIFDRYVWPKALEKVDLNREEITVTEEAKRCLLEEYAPEPGVRDLERAAERLASNYLLNKEAHGLTGIIFSQADIRKLLGPPRVVKRNLVMRPGMAFGAYCLEGRAHTFALQAAAQPGSGKLHLINVAGRRQQEHCRLAYACVGLLSGGQLRSLDVTLAAAEPLQDVMPGNYVGFAASAAILSALQGREFAASELFLGGCDLYGTLYLDERTIDPYLEQLPGQFKTIYSAIGAAGLIYEPHPQTCVSIVESPNISALFQTIIKI